MIQTGENMERVKL